MAWLHLGRVLGIALLTVGVIPLVMAIVERRQAAVWMVAGVMAAGLLVALGCSRALQERREHRVRLERQRAKEFSEPALQVGIRWGKLCLMTALAVGLALAMGIVCLKIAVDGQIGIAVLTGALAVMAGGIAVSWLALARRAANAGYALRLDKHGVQHAGEPLIEWRDIEGAGLLQYEHRGMITYSLCLTVDSSRWPAVKGWHRYLPTEWSRPRLFTRAMLKISLQAIAGSPYVIEGAIRALARRHAPRFFDPEAQLAKLDELGAMLGAISPESVLALPVAEQEKVLQKAMSDLEQWKYKVRSH